MAAFVVVNLISLSSSSSLIYGGRKKINEQGVMSADGQTETDIGGGFACWLACMLLLINSSSSASALFLDFGSLLPPPPLLLLLPLLLLVLLL